MTLYLILWYYSLCAAMDINEIHRLVRLVTGEISPVTDYEREKLRQGDQKLLAVLTHKPLLDRWDGEEPPIDRPMPQKAHHVRRYVGRPR